MAAVVTPNPSILGWRMSSSSFNVVGLTFATFDVCEGAVPPWPAASSVPSGAHRRLSRRKPTETLSLLTGVCPRDKRMKDWLPHPPMYSHLPSSEISRPFGPAASLPGTFFHPVSGCHSQTSPLISPAMGRPRVGARRRVRRHPERPMELEENVQVDVIRNFLGLRERGLELTENPGTL